MRKLTLLLATITLATIVLALPAAPLRAGNCGGDGGGGILKIPTFQSVGGDCNTVPEPSSFVLISMGIGALGLILVLRELKASKAAGGQASRS
jgi:PEP-CTERM motif